MALVSPQWGWTYEGKFLTLDGKILYSELGPWTPEQLTAAYVGDSALALTWRHGQAAATFKVYKKMVVADPWVVYATLPAGTTEYLYEGLAVGKPTFLTVSAVVGIEESEIQPGYAAWQKPIINPIGTNDVLAPSEFPVTVSGVADLNQQVTVAVGGKSKVVTASNTGVWSAQFTYAEVGAGNKSVSASVALGYSYGNTTRSRAFVVGPEAPSMSRPGLANPIKLSGTATPGAQINLYVDGVLKSASIVVAENGTWEFTTSLPSGAHTAYATQVVGGLESGQSAAQSFTVAGGTVLISEGFENIPRPPSVGKALQIIGNAGPIQNGISRDFKVEINGAVSTDFEVTSSEPGTVRVTKTADGFTAEVIGGGAEQVEIKVRKIQTVEEGQQLNLDNFQLVWDEYTLTLGTVEVEEHHAPSSIILKINQAFVADATILVSGDLQAASDLIRRSPR